MQKHWDVMRSDNAGEMWTEVSGNLPTDFGFPIDVHAHEPETIYVVPIKSDSEHFPPDGKLRVYRSKTGGNEWEPLTKGLPQKDCYVNVLRDAMAVDSLDECGIYFGTTGGQVYASADGGDTWNAIVRDLPPSFRRSADAAMIRVVLPFHLRTSGAGRATKCSWKSRRRSRSVRFSMRSKLRYPVLRGTIRDQATQKRRPLVRFFCCREDFSHETEPRRSPLPGAAIAQRQAEPFIVIESAQRGRDSLLQERFATSSKASSLIPPSSRLGMTERSSLGEAPSSRPRRQECSSRDEYGPAGRPARRYPADSARRHASLVC